MSDAWDGRPVDPGRTQVAWLRCGEHEPEPALWCSLHNAWFMFDGGSPSKPSDIAETFNYLGPCLTPAEVAAREAAAWRAGRDAAAAYHEAEAKERGENDSLYSRLRMHTHYAEDIRALQPPADLAAAIAAFLRALPDVIRSTPFGANSDGMLHTRQTYFAGDLAAAVEEAARDA